MAVSICLGSYTGKPFKPTVLLPALMLLSSFGSARSQQVPFGFSVDYTGALFGYYRIEPTSSKPLFPAVLAFGKERAQRHQTLLLGMGDNFAPEFGASLQLTGEKTQDCYEAIDTSDSKRDLSPPEILYKEDTRVAKKVECDNVANFLLREGYRAVVPGREDFLYSAGWLRKIAILLRERSEPVDETKDPTGRLHILAANLRITSNSPKKHDCPLLFAGKLIAKGNTQCTDSEGEQIPVAQDWVDRLDLTFKSNEELAGKINKAAQNDPEVRRQLLANQVSQLLAMNPPTVHPKCEPNSECKDPSTWKQLASIGAYRVSGTNVELIKEPTGGKRDSYSDLVDEVKFLAALAATPKGGELTKFTSGKKKTDEEVFLNQFASTPKGDDLAKFARGIQDMIDRLNDSSSPQCEKNLLLSDDLRVIGRNSLLRVIADEQADSGYTFSDRKGADGKVSRTLLVAVIGSETMKAVSPTNLLVETRTVEAPADEKTSPTTGQIETRILNRPKDNPKEEWQVKSLDPRRTVLAVIRAATLVANDSGRQVDRTIVMAQMPRTEAEELAAHLKTSLKRLDLASLKIDLVLSEAQAEHATPNEHITRDPMETTPVLTPHPAFSRDFTGNTGGLVNPISTATLCPDGIDNKTKSNKFDAEEYPTALGKFEELIGVGAESKALKDQEENKAGALEFLLQQLQKSSKADVVLLERRDIYLEQLPQSYANYEVCETFLAESDPKKSSASTPQPLNAAEKRSCQIRVALDRILWKGDYSERVMVSGKDLKAMLKTAQSQETDQESLAARDTTDQWLVTYGITTNDPKQLTRLEVREDRFVLPEDKACRGNMSAIKPETPYCVNGSTIAEDASYWVETSSHIANDGITYTTMKALPDDYHQRMMNKFLTAEMTKVIVNLTTPVDDLPPTMWQAQRTQQQRRLLHLDYGKLVAGFNIRNPDGGNTAASNFQGVTDTRASQPTQQELDLETLSRVVGDIPGHLPFSVGVQTDAEYDRATLGNLTGKPINASYAVNSFTVGGFLQKRIPFWGDAKTADGNWGNRELPRSLIVLTPHQYQQQMTGSFLFIPFTAGNGEYTLHAPIVSGLVDKLGFRHELGGGKWWKADRASYWETGLELGIQNNVLKSLTLFTRSQSLPCSAATNVTIAQCASTAKFPIDASTTIIDPATGKSTLVTETLHTSGIYWDIHMQKGLVKDPIASVYGINLSLDSKGDFFFERPAGASLSTQTRYAFPITAAVNFPIFRNLSLSPTWTSFFYESQVSRESIVVNSLSVSARWYFDRDSAVPIRRQLFFRGPASLDQTKTAKLK
jgi:hypothetical protein